MKFDELDQKMRVFETAHDHCVLPGLYIVARLDGLSFTRLTREVHKFAAPFDERFRDYMIATTEHLLNCGFHILYGYTQSDEETFGRKLRKYDSILAGEASAKFSLLLGSLAGFDSRISQLPSVDLVAGYFCGRGEDAHRNARKWCQLTQHGPTWSEAVGPPASSILSDAELRTLLAIRNLAYK